ncbi:MAG TPA: hypothetical protein VIV06_06070 [Candidatus Limnocylindrales bacterium]
MTDGIDEQFERLLRKHAPVVGETARRARALIHEAMLSPVEEVDAASGLLAIGTSQRMRDLLFAIIPHTAHVNIQLIDGVDLPDPTGIVEGTGKRVRHLKCRSIPDVERPAVRDVIAAQAALRRS